MAKVDIYNYSSPTDVNTVTLSNCDSTTVSDYAIVVQRDVTSNDDIANGVTFMIEPHAISGTTMTLQDGGAITKCKCIMVTQKGA